MAHLHTDLLQSLTVKHLGEDQFESKHIVTRTGRVYGGELFAQATIALAKTVPTDRAINSLHGYFLRPGNIDQTTTWQVNRIREGKNYSFRQISAYQSGKEIFTALGSFSIVLEPQTLDFHLPLPSLHLPDTVNGDITDAVSKNNAHGIADENFHIRRREQDIFYEPDPNPSTDQVIWVKTFDQLPDDPIIHQAALAWVSDYALLEPALRQRGLSWSTPGLSMATIDHSLWWHRPVRLDQWVVINITSPSGHRGRTMGTEVFYDAQGVAVASAAQEGTFILNPED